MVQDTVLDKKSLIEEVVAGREIADMYLKHPGNESSSDDEGTEQERDVQGMSNILRYLSFK